MSTTDNSNVSTPNYEPVMVNGNVYLHIHDYNLIAYDNEDGAPAINVLSKYPRLHNYHIIVIRECNSVDNCPASARWTHIAVMSTKMSYQQFMREIGKFRRELGMNGDQLVAKMKESITEYVIQKARDEGIRVGTERAGELLKFPNFLPDIPAEVEWNREFPEGPVRDGLFLD
jgi:hypothetical protein